MKSEVEEYPCSFCGNIYANEDAVQTCVKCEVAWCPACSVETFCPECAKKDEATEDPEEYEPPLDMISRFCKVCKEKTATWNDQGVIVCLKCGESH